MSKNARKTLNLEAKYNPDNLTEADMVDILRVHYQHDFFSFLQNVLEYHDVNVKTHGDIIKCLTDESLKKLIVQPRGSLKSSICTVGFSTWNIIKNPNVRILIDSAFYKNSKNFIREIRAHLKKPILTKLFGEFEHPTNWSEGSITVRQRTKALKESTVTASGIGASKVSQHYDIIIIDDINDEKNSRTLELRENVLDHYRRTISLLEPGGILIIVGTRYSANDVIGFVFENEIQMVDPGLS